MLTPTTNQRVDRFGKLAVVTYDVADHRTLMQAIRTDLINTINGSLPTDPQYAPFYSGILTSGVKLGHENRDRIYFELRDAARSRIAKQQEATEQMRKLDAQRIATFWKNQEREAQPGP